MSECSFELCQNSATGTCQKCRKTFCDKHLFSGSFTGPGSNRQVYGTYCNACMQEFETTQAFKPGSRWNSGAAIQIYILIAVIAVLATAIYLIFYYK